jgi:hypothetical protein
MFGYTHRKGTLGSMLTALRLAIAAGVVTFALPATSSATVVRSLSLAQKAAIAPLIVHAEVEKVESRKVSEAVAVETLIHVKVIEGLKGDAKKGQRLVLRQSGGTVGELRHEVVGQSHFTRGEQAILFLEPLPNGRFVEIGVGIGKYGIERTDKGSVVTHAPKVALAIEQPGQPARIEDAQPMTPIPLHDFLVRVRGFAKGGKVNPIEHDGVKR